MVRANHSELNPHLTFLLNFLIEKVRFMKNLNLFLSILACLLLTTTNVLANTDSFACRATCVLVDSSKRAMYIFGSVKGFSERDITEAFDVMAQACHNKVTQSGFSGFEIALVKGVAKIDSHNIEYGREAHTSNAYFKLGFVVNLSQSQTSADSASYAVDRKFSYELNFADESSCGKVKSNLNGNPKYIGPDQPLG